MKLLIVDDEPLVQVGIKSMLNWSDLDIEICGVASNGQAALQVIETHHPEIIITDIQMPVMDGLSLIKAVANKYGNIPVFILLTSYEEFDYVKTAISYHAIDYLIKLDLDADILSTAIEKAKKAVALHSQTLSSDLTEHENLLLFQNRFYSKLLNNLFSSERDLKLQMNNLNLALDYSGYAVAQLEVVISKSVNHNSENFQVFRPTLQLFKELVQKYIACKVIVLDVNYCAIIFCFDTCTLPIWREKLTTSLLSIDEMIYNYYNVHLSFCIGQLVTQVSDIHASYYDTKQLAPCKVGNHGLFFYDDWPAAVSLRNVVNLSLFRDDISKAFEQMDVVLLDDIFNNIFSLLEGDKDYYLQALDVAGSILHLSINMLPNGHKVVSDIFKDTINSYHSLYQLQSVKQIINWLKHFRDGLFLAFENMEDHSENYLISHVKKYITNNLYMKLLLQDIARHFDVSPNYLSHLFKKNMGIGINEYISQIKIGVAKQLLLSDNRRVYEISNELGYESAFYFSKVFKKYTGLSPKEYRSIQINKV